MILSFMPSSDLIDLVWNAAVVSAETVGEITPLNILGPLKQGRVSRGRELVAMLLKEHVWLSGTPHNAEQNEIEIGLAITFRPECPYPDARRPIRLSTPMIGYLLGRDHSAIVLALTRARQNDDTMSRFLQARTELAKYYSDAPLYTTARVRVGACRRRWCPTEPRSMAKGPMHNPNTCNVG